MMIKKILVGIADKTYTASATRHAIEIAKRFDASLTGLSVLDYARLRTAGAGTIGTSGLNSEVREVAIQNTHSSIDEAVDVFVRLCGDQGITHDFQKVAGDPFEEFIDRSRYHDLMVFGLRRLFEHGVLVEPPHGLVKLISAGVRPILAAGPQYREIRRVLVAYSGSIESAKTMRRFVQLSGAWPATTVRIVWFGQVDSDSSTLLTDAREYMQAHGVEPEIEAVADSPRTGVLQQATDWQADMIVLGNSSKTLLRRRVLGETSLYTIQESELPLFLAQ